jgi:hypothetical protein
VQVTWSFLLALQPVGGNGQRQCWRLTAQSAKTRADSNIQRCNAYLSPAQSQCAAHRHAGAWYHGMFADAALYCETKIRVASCITYRAPRFVLQRPLHLHRGKRPSPGYRGSASWRLRRPLIDIIMPLSCDTETPVTVCRNVARS